MCIVTKHRKNDIDQRTLVDNYQAAMIVAQNIREVQGCRVTVDKVAHPAPYGRRFRVLLKSQRISPHATYFQTSFHGC